MAVIIYSRKSWKSGKLLGQLLKIPASKPQRFRGVPDIMIRWGCGTDFLEAGFVEIQPASAVRLAVNKSYALDIMEAEGVSVPRHGDLFSSILNFPVYVRTTTHTKGQGLWFCTNEDEVGEAFRRGGTHWIEAITGPRVEYRIHIGRIGNDYRILYRQRKFLPPEEKSNSSPWQDLVRNFRNGWRFSSIPRVNRETAREAKAAVSALGLDFGAVDIVRTEAGDAHVLEVNTAPALVFRGTIMAYVRFFEEKLNIETDPAHIETLIQEIERR